MTLGESAGFLAPAVAGVVAVELWPAGGWLLVLGAGAVEGVILGWAQASVLRRALPRTRRVRWVALTAAGAVVAYLLGSYLAVSGVGWSALPALAVAGPLLLMSIGAAQWVELRHHVPRADLWVRWTAFAWLAALIAFSLISTPLWHEGQPPAQAIAIGAFAGIVMATVQAAVTGYALVRLLGGLGGLGGLDGPDQSRSRRSGQRTLVRSNPQAHARSAKS